MLAEFGVELDPDVCAGTCRWAFAASTHHMRSSAKRGKARSRAFPPSPIGSPSADSVCPMGPTAIVLETTTMPISE